MKDIQSIVAEYISENHLGWPKARRKRRLPKVHMVYKKPRLRLRLVLEDEVKETFALLFGTAILVALLSVARAPYLDAIFSWL